MPYTYEFSERYKVWMILRNGKLITFAENEADAKQYVTRANRYEETGLAEEGMEGKCGTLSP